MAKKQVNNDADEDSGDVAGALKKVEEIKDLIDEDVPEWAFKRASSFFEDVREKVKDVGETIERTKRVTERQMEALEGWETGVRKWIK